MSVLVIIPFIIKLYVYEIHIRKKGNMINLYIDFDGVIKDTIRVSYKMMADLGIDLNNRADVIKFYQSIDC